MTVSELRPYRVEQGVDEYQLAATTRRNYFRSINACLRWPIKQGYINANPMENLEVPGGERKKVYIPPDEFDALLCFVPDETLCDETLCDAVRLDGDNISHRLWPQESLRVTAAHVERGEARWLFSQNESKGKKFPRIDYLEESSI